VNEVSTVASKNDTQQILPKFGKKKQKAEKYCAALN
jgi:hypothetical protein